MKNKSIVRTNATHRINWRYDDNEKTKIPKTNVNEKKKKSYLIWTSPLEYLIFIILFPLTKVGFFIEPDSGFTI
jgi:hypothetical protein